MFFSQFAAKKNLPIEFYDEKFKVSTGSSIVRADSVFISHMCLARNEYVTPF